MKINTTIARGLLVLSASLALAATAQSQRKPRLLSDCGKCDGFGRMVIVNGGDLCLDADKARMTTNRGGVQVWECKDVAEQRWTWNGKKLVNGGGLCLEADPATRGENMGKVWVWQCSDGRPGQQWDRKGLSLVNDKGMCLDAHRPDMGKNGGRVQVFNCVDNAPPQQWRFGTFEN